MNLDSEVNNTEESTKNDKEFGKFNNIAVVGDVTRDFLRSTDTDGTPTEEIGQGGSLFVSKILNLVIKSDDNEPSIKGYDVLDEEKSNFPKVIWDTKTHKKKKDDLGVVRCINTVTALSPKTAIAVPEGYQEPIHLWQGKKDSFEMLVVQDLNFYTKQLKGGKVKIEKSNSERWTWALDDLHLDLSNTSYYPQIFLKIDGGLPDLNQPFWDKLMDDNDENKDFKEKSLAIIYADTLRISGLSISKRISWERTAQDYLRELYTHSVMKHLSKLKHLIIRFGVSGAIHSYRIDEWRHHRLFFDPHAHQLGIHRDPATDGDVIGNQSIFLTSIIKDLINKKNNAKQGDTESAHEIAETISVAIRKAIVRCQNHFDNGLGSEFSKAAESLREPMSSYVNLFEESEKKWPKWTKIAHERIPVGNTSWSIINQSASYNLLEVAKDIVANGIQNSVNRYKTPDAAIWAPVVKFGKVDEEKLVVVDRKEIESYRAVYRLLKKTVVAKNTSKRPISIAVFGPPGSGKSFVVKEILKSLSPDGSKIDRRIINISQLKSPEELSEKLKENPGLEKLEKLLDLTKKMLSPTDNKKDKAKIIKEVEEIRSVIKDHKQKTPCIFLDEFDCSTGKVALAWLKSFLSLMEEWDEDSPEKCPIYIFAGGTSYTFRDFEKEDLSPDTPQRLEFLKAKGPDFVSRLDGHINILGPDQADDHDEVYVLRRAVILRSLIRNHIRLDEGEKLGPDKGENLEIISKKIVNAMLKVTNYKHGMRSMRAILDMSVKLGGPEGLFVSGTLPPLPQLDMHVDGKEFMDRITESSN